MSNSIKIENMLSNKKQKVYDDLNNTYKHYKINNDTTDYISDISDKLSSSVSSDSEIEIEIVLDNFIEPLLDSKNARENVYPIEYQDIYEYYKTHQSLFWTAAEVDLTKDLRDWDEKLNDDEKYYIKMILSFFAGSDFIVNEKEEKSQEEVKVLEYKWFTRDKIAREDVHSISYANMIEAYINDPIEKEKLKHAIKTIPSIKKKADWFRKYINNDDFVKREVASAITEGIYFSGSFCGIFWLKKRGLLPGLCDYNELISRDEGMHRDFSCMIYSKYIKRKLDENELLDMVKEAVDIEIEFCTESLPVKLIGMDHVSMIQYIKYVADKLLLLLIGKKYYNVVNPFEWMVYISLLTNTDFFAHRPTSYSKQKNLTDSSENMIKFNEDY